MPSAANSTLSTVSQNTNKNSTRYYKLMLIDQLDIRYKAGNGGNGIVSFRKEKFIPFGGPSGGDGGNGGNVIVRASGRFDSLAHIKEMRAAKGENGEPGGSSKKHGRSGADLVLYVPLGTMVERAGVDSVHLDTEDAEVVVGKGGKGGYGNVRFTTAENRAPRVAQAGQRGEEGVLRLRTSLQCDFAIIGMPNSGKSTLLNCLTAAKAKVADYPFTTREVTRGVYERVNRAFVLLEIPAIVEGAHVGKGLGLDFLRHLQKARVVIHLVDRTADDVLGNVEKVNRELSFFDPALAAKPQVVAVNKCDLPEVKERLGAIKSQLKGMRAEVRFISAATGDGIDDLMASAIRTLEAGETKEAGEVEKATIILRPKQRPKATVYRKGSVVVIEGRELEDVFERTDISNRDAQAFLRRLLVRAGVLRLLKKEGVEIGERVRCGKVEWEWQWPL